MFFNKISTNFLQESKQLISVARYYKRNMVFHSQPKLKLRTVQPVYPPPGLNLQIPEWKHEDFLMRIGGGCSDYADKFESLNQVFELNRDQLKEKGVPATQRKHIFRIREMLRRGVLTFDYLERRTTLKKPTEAKK